MIRRRKIQTDLTGTGREHDRRRGSRKALHVAQLPVAVAGAVVGRFLNVNDGVVD